MMELIICSCGTAVTMRQLLWEWKLWVDYFYRVIFNSLLSDNYHSMYHLVTISSFQSEFLAQRRANTTLNVKELVSARLGAWLETAPDRDKMWTTHLFYPVIFNYPPGDSRTIHSLFSEFNYFSWVTITPWDRLPPM